MDKKQQMKIPGYIWGIALVLIGCIIYLIAVQIPFMKAKPGLDQEHASDQSQIAIYEEYTNNASIYQAKIDEMKAEYLEKSKVLFVNATRTRDEIYDMIESFKYQPNTISVAEGQKDPIGRKSSAGEPLYTTSIVLSMEISQQMLLETLDYYEGAGDSSAKGAYYISEVTVAPVTDKETNQVVKDKYKVTLKMELYYFNPEATVKTSSVATST